MRAKLVGGAAVILVLTLLLVSAREGMGGAKAGAPSTKHPVLLKESDLSYVGAFRLPQGRFGTVSRHRNSFSTDAGRALSFNPLHNSLFLMGNVKEVLLAELSIPEKIVKSTDLSRLTVASVRQAPFEITDGLGCFIGPGGASKCSSHASTMTAGNVLIGGTLVDVARNRLVGTTYTTYDGNATTTFSHFTANADNWSNEGAKAQGMYRVGGRVEDTNALSAGFVGGYLAWIPDEWREKFGGPALTGQAALAIVSRTSFGPSAFVFNPARLGDGKLGSESAPVPATPLVYYPGTHQTLGRYADKTSANPGYNQGTEITGLVFPSGTRSVLFFGRTGLGVSCYGSGTTVREQAADNKAIKVWLRAANPDYPAITVRYSCGSARLDGKGNLDCCYDPASSYKGVHAYPYAYYVWAYDALNLLKVRKGEAKPWEVLPYAQWNLNGTFDPFAPQGNDGIAGHGMKRISGAAYDMATQRIYITQAGGDSLGGESLPLIHVFEILAR